MMLGSKSILTPLIPDCYVLCTLAIFKNIRNPLIFLWKMATYSYFWRVKSSKSLLQASLHRLFDLLTLVSYNKAKQPSDIKKVSGGCFFELRIGKITASVKNYSAWIMIWIGGETNWFYEVERCSRTFKIMYNNKLFNMCLRKSDTDKTIVEPPLWKYKYSLKKAE